MFNQNNQSSGVETRPFTRQISQPSKLSRLPSLSDRKPLSFQIPAFPAAPEVRKDICAACEKRIGKDDEFSQTLRVCRKCIGIHATVETAIDRKSIEAHKAAKLGEWAKKIGGAK